MKQPDNEQPVKAEEVEISESKLVHDILKRATLETRLRVMLQMGDFDNWENGKYYGEIDKKYLKFILQDVQQWMKDGAEMYDKIS